MYSSLLTTKYQNCSHRISTFPFKKKSLLLLGKISVLWISKSSSLGSGFILFSLSSAVQNLQAPSTWVIKQQQGCLKQPQATAQGWAGSFPLDLPPPHSVFWEHHCTGWYKLHGDTMQVHLLSRNHLCPRLPDNTSSSKGWECNARGRRKAWAVSSWEWGEEGKQAQWPVAHTYLQHTDEHICPKHNPTREEDPDSCSRVHRENWPLSSSKKKYKQIKPNKTNKKTLNIFW